jgi:hypothetical protein
MIRSENGILRKKSGSSDGIVWSIVGGELSKP